jgi:hypothetical protein
MDGRMTDCDMLVFMVSVGKPIQLNIWYWYRLKVNSAVMICFLHAIFPISSTLRAMPTAIDPSELQLSIPAIYARLTEVTEYRIIVSFITLVWFGRQRSQFPALISPCDLVVISRIAGFRRLSGTT